MVAEALPGEMRVKDIWPGGTSGILGSPNYAQFVARYLANDSLTTRLGNDEVVRERAEVQKYVPVE